MSNTPAFIAFGGNLGQVRATFIQARHELAQTDGIRLLASSKLYRTPPVGPAGQPDYLNAVIMVETTLEPADLLQQLHRIENLHGRERTERWGARTLDLDLVACGDLHLASEHLTIPHLLMHERMFVLCPLCDIAPSWQHPVSGQTAQELLHQLLAKGESPLPDGEVW